MTQQTLEIGFQIVRRNYRRQNNCTITLNVVFLVTGLRKTSQTNVDMKVLYMHAQPIGFWYTVIMKVVYAMFYI